MNNETKIKIGERAGLSFTGDNEAGEPQFVGTPEQFDEYFEAREKTGCCNASIVEQTGRCSKCLESV